MISVDVGENAISSHRIASSSGYLSSIQLADLSRSEHDQKEIDEMVGSFRRYDYISKTGNLLCGLCIAVSMGGMSVVLGAVRSPQFYPQQHSSSVGFILVRWAPVESVPAM